MNIVRQFNKPSASSMLFSHFTKNMSQEMKPPNILIYDGEVQKTESFNSLKDAVLACVKPNSYTVYHLSNADVFTTPWYEHSKLLLVSANKVQLKTSTEFMRYVTAHGSILSLSEDFNANMNNTEEFMLENSVDLKPQKIILDNLMKMENHDVIDHEAGCSPAFVKYIYDRGQILCCNSSITFRGEELKALLRKVLPNLGLDCEQCLVPNISPVFLFTANDRMKENFLTALPSTKSKLSVFSTSNSSNHSDRIPLITDAEVFPGFDIKNYSNDLSSKILGRTLLYSEVTTSTNDTLDEMMCSIPSELGLTAIARLQISGKGRGGNAWLSPDGCACFSFLIKIPLYSVLGQAIPCIQHIASLAIIQAVRSLPGYENLNMRLKWPNDLYTSDGRKLGGILVKSSCFQRDILAIVGCGVNVNNSKPTTCINDLIQDHNARYNTELEKITIESLLARTLNEMEVLMEMFSENRDLFLKMYYNVWLHSEQEVYLKSENSRVKILGIDDCGYLSVKTEKGDIRSLHPDGNSFDMMHNMIQPKY